MFAHVVAEGKIQARTLLFDAWYSGSDHLKLIRRAGWTFFTTLKSNWLVSPSKEIGYQALDAVAPPPGGWSTGLEVRLKQVPFAVRLFKLVAPNGDIEWVVTNNFAFALTKQLVEATTRTRWQVAEFHRSFKQLTGAEKCQCRKASTHRNSLTCCYLAWVSLRQFAGQSAQTVYQAHQQQWALYLCQLLQNPTIPALPPASAQVLKVLTARF